MSIQELNDKDETVPLTEQASRWWVVLNGEGASAADRREFGEWVARSPERIAAWLNTERLMRALQGSDVSWPETPADELIGAARSAGADVVPLSPAPVREASGGVRWSFKPVWVAAALVIAMAGIWPFLQGTEEYQTALGEQHSVVLDDGSVVTLNTASKIEVALGQQRREVRLLAGEALFQVAQDKARPFEVIAGATTVRAVGTQFNVDRRAAQTTVTVIEGKVLVDAVPVTAAERVVVSGAKVSTPERLANVAPVTAWTQRRLIFERRPLGEVAQEFNRYNRRHIEIDSAALRDQEVTGVFQANDPESFVTFLSQLPGITVQRTPEGAVKIF